MTSINSDTKISTIIKLNSESIDAIAGIAPPLAKLRNPVLRKILASRVTIAEAAKMGGCSVDDFAKVLFPLGFTFENVSKENTSDSAVQKPAWLLNANNNHITKLDVRAALAAGEDPLHHITKAFKQLAPGEILCIINSFEPVPLMRLLGKEGILSFTEIINEKEYNTWFLKPEVITTGKASTGNFIKNDAAGFQQLLHRFENKLHTIDVRQMEMPLPMQTILAALKNLPLEKALHVFHKKLPVYLLEHLADSDYVIQIWEVAEGNVHLLIYKRDV